MSDEQLSVIDYIAVHESLRNVLDAKVVRGLFAASDHYVVLAKLRGSGSLVLGNNSTGYVRIDCMDKSTWRF